jgi:hypothetical protein
MYGMSIKKELLKKEGIKFQDDDNLREILTNVEWILKKRYGWILMRLRLFYQVS